MNRAVTLVAVGSGIFGGMVGALATAATQSAASPQAVAGLTSYQAEVETLLQMICLNTIQIAFNGGSSASLTGHDPVLPAGCEATRPAVPFH